MSATPTDARAIRRHVAGCAVCCWLQQYAIRTRAPALLEAAIRLRETHAANDAERAAMVRPRQRSQAQPIRHRLR